MLIRRARRIGVRNERPAGITKLPDECCVAQQHVEGAAEGLDDRPGGMRGSFGHDGELISEPTACPIDHARQQIVPATKCPPQQTS